MNTIQTINPSDSNSQSSNLPYMGQVDFESRNRALKALANAAGIRLPNTRVPEGESLLPVGEENKRALAVEVDALPDLEDGMLALKHRVGMERPRDVAVPLQRVRMDGGRGGLFGEGQPAEKALGYTHNGFGHIAAFAKPGSVRGGFAATLLALPPSIRAQAFNHFAETAVRPETKEVILRTHLAGVVPQVVAGVEVIPTPRRIIRAVVSPQYSAVDDVDLLTAMIQASIPAGAKLRVTRGSDDTFFEILWPAMKREIRVGDAVLIGVRARNSETKAGAVVVSGSILRALCYNFTTAWSEGAETEISIRHVGEARRRVGEAIVKAIATVEPFIKAFADAYQNELPAFAPTRGEVLQMVGKVFELPTATLEDCVGAWDADGAKSAGDTLAGLVNAMTRASQKLSMADAAVVENAAGKMVARGWAALND